MLCIIDLKRGMALDEEEVYNYKSSQLSQLVEPLFSDPGPKSGIGVRAGLHFKKKEKEEEDKRKGIGSERFFEFAPQMLGCKEKVITGCTCD